MTRLTTTGKKDIFADIQRFAPFMASTAVTSTSGTGSDTIGVSESIVVEIEGVVRDLEVSIGGAGAAGGTGDITGVTAGTGLTGGGTSGDVTLNTGAGDGITVNADDVALTTPGTLTSTTTNTSVGNHTHAITTTADGKANPLTILQANASGVLTLLRVNIWDRIVHNADTDTYLEFTNNQLDCVIGGNTTITSQPNEAFIYGQFTYPSAYPLTVQGKGANETGPAVQLLVQNTAEETVVSQDYANEAHIRLQAGSTTDHRRYINFADYTGTDKWLTGANASNTWILYNATTVHRLWFDETGNNYVNAANARSVYINYHATDTVGTGGLIVHTGGAPSTNIQIFSVAQASGADSTLNMNINSGDTASQVTAIYLKDQNTNKFHIRKSAINDLDIYDYGAARYALFWDTSAARMGIGHNLPSTLFHVQETDAGTTDIVSLITSGRESSGTPAAGFGSALSFLAETATVSKRAQGRLTFEWITATDASRAAGGRLTAYSVATEQEAIAWDGDSGGVKLGFYGTTPVAQAATIADADGTLADITTKFNTLLADLEGLGLLAAA